MSALRTQLRFCYGILTRFRTRMSQQNFHNQLFWSNMNLLFFVEYLRNCFKQIESVKTAAKGSRIANRAWFHGRVIDFEKASLIDKGSLVTLDNYVRILLYHRNPRYGLLQKFLSSPWTITITTPIIGHILFSVFVIFHLFILRIFIAPFGSILKRANTPKICTFFLTSLFAFCHRC